MLDKLAGGTTLVCDRYAFSGIVYSWAKQRDTMDLGWLKAIEAPLPAPDAVFFMNVGGGGRWGTLGRGTLGCGGGFEREMR